MIRFLVVTMLLCSLLSTAQGFTFHTSKKKAVIPFTLVSNLIILPVEVNGVELHFLLDSGVEETILFSIEDKKEVKFYNVEKIMLRGLGNQESVEGLKSTNNRLRIRGLELSDQDILIVLDEAMNFSSSLGIEVNGILGYKFFKDNIVEINYAKRKIFVHRPESFKPEGPGKKFSSFDMSIEKSKPYISGKVGLNGESLETKLLVDTGNSDALWLFPNRSDKIKVPERNFYDFLGRGFSGEVFGRKARVVSFELGDFRFEKPIVSFPDSLSLQNVKMVQDRVGSVGSEILRRFVVLFDYRNGRLFLKKNAHFDMAFHYNMSGIEIHHAGLQMVHEEYKPSRFNGKAVKVNYGDEQVDVRFRFQLKPVYEIASVRAASPAEKAGLRKSDRLKMVNGFPAYKFSLQQVNTLLRDHPDRILVLVIERDGAEVEVKVRLEDVL